MRYQSKILWYPCMHDHFAKYTYGHLTHCRSIIFIRKIIVNRVYISKYPPHVSLLWGNQFYITSCKSSQKLKPILAVHNSVAWSQKASWLDQFQTQYVSLDWGNKPQPLVLAGVETKHPFSILTASLWRHHTRQIPINILNDFCPSLEFCGSKHTRLEINF